MLWIAIAKETGNANQDASQPAILSIDWSKAPKESIIGKDTDKKTDKKTDSEDKNNDTAASKALLKNSIKMAERC